MRTNYKPTVNEVLFADDGYLAESMEERYLRTEIVERNLCSPAWMHPEYIALQRRKGIHWRLYLFIEESRKRNGMR